MATLRASIFKGFTVTANCVCCHAFVYRFDQCGKLWPSDVKAMCVGRMSSSSVDSFSCVDVDTKVIHVTLPLNLIGNPVSGIHTIFDSWKNQYVPSLDGVLLSYRKIALKNKLGRLITDYPFVHYDVQAEFSVFRPTVGGILRGTVNRISREHVGCVVHDCINVSIHHMTSLATDVEEIIKIGNSVLFKVTKVEILRKTFRIHGEVSRKCYRLMTTELQNGLSEEDNTVPNEEVAVSTSRTDSEEVKPRVEEVVTVKVEKETSGEEEGKVESYVKVGKRKRRKRQ